MLFCLKCLFFIKQTFEQNAKPPDLILSKDFDSVKSFESICLFAGEAGGMQWLKKDFNFEFEWIDTMKVEKQGSQILKKLSGIWSASGGAFKSLHGTLYAKKFARTHNIPHSGTCRGFQHTIMEFA